jgi:hypothetical protein
MTFARCPGSHNAINDTYILPNPFSILRMDFAIDDITSPIEAFNWSLVIFKHGNLPSELIYRSEIQAGIITLSLL